MSLKLWKKKTTDIGGSTLSLILLLKPEFKITHLLKLMVDFPKIQFQDGTVCKVRNVAECTVPISLLCWCLFGPKQGRNLNLEESLEGLSGGLRTRSSQVPLSLLRRQE